MQKKNFSSGPRCARFSYRRSHMVELPLNDEALNTTVLLFWKNIQYNQISLPGYNSLNTFTTLPIPPSHHTHTHTARGNEGCGMHHIDGPVIYC